MNNTMSLNALLPAAGGLPAQQSVLFALLSLGMIESLANGLIGATEALQVFFNAENCRFVRKQLREKLADAIMSHGVQLPDVFEVLPPEEAHRQFQRELATMHALCLKLLEGKQLVA